MSKAPRKGTIEHALEAFAIGDDAPMIALLSKRKKLRDEWRKPRTGEAHGMKFISTPICLTGFGVSRPLSEVSDIVRALDARDAAKAAGQASLEGLS